MVLLGDARGDLPRAIYSAQRLVRPVQDLIEGTRASVYSQGRPRDAPAAALARRDGLPALLQRHDQAALRRARAWATHSQQAVERERARLAILARLSCTGVLAVDHESLTVRTANEAAGAILGTDLSGAAGRPPGARRRQRAARAVRGCALAGALRRAGARMAAEQARSQRQAVAAARSCKPRTPLPGEGDVGFVLGIVFDEHAALLQAQRDAAWGEVARRLARTRSRTSRTPIQLSADGCAARLLAGRWPQRDALEILERGNAHHRAAGGGDAADGERVLRSTQRAPEMNHALQPRSAVRDRGRGPQHTARRTCVRTSAWSWMSTSRGSRPIAATCGRSSTIWSRTRWKPLTGPATPAPRDHDAVRVLWRCRVCAAVTV